jgi:8-hydroxy-5-deazaflavin:NADPH oxidoreductase
MASCDDAEMSSTSNAQTTSFPTPADANPEAFGTVAVLGGTGPQGRGLARRFAAAGVPCILGSRDAARAHQAAQPMADAGLPVLGADNAGAAAAGQIVIVAVPYEGHEELLKSLTAELAGKIVVDCVNPMGFDKQGAYQLTVPEGSAAQQAALVLPESTVVAAFHHVSAVLLEDETVDTIEKDVFVLGDDREATDLIGKLADIVPGMRGVFAGRLRNAGQVEALTANLISVNRRYKAHAGLRVTDV